MLYIEDTLPPSELQRLEAVSGWQVTGLRMDLHKLVVCPQQIWLRSKLPWANITIFFLSILITYYKINFYLFELF